MQMQTGQLFNPEQRTRGDRTVECGNKTPSLASASRNRSSSQLQQLRFTGFIQIMAPDACNRTGRYVYEI